MFLSLDGLGNLGPGPPSQRHWLSTMKSCLPLRGITGHLIHWQPGREGDSSDYPILQGCTVSRVQGCLHCAMLTLRTEAKNSPATHPLSTYLPLLSLVLLFSRGTRRRIQTNPTWGAGIKVAPPPNTKCAKEGGGHLYGGYPPPGEQAGAAVPSQNTQAPSDI